MTHIKARLKRGFERYEWHCPEYRRVSNVCVGVGISSAIALAIVTGVSMPWPAPISGVGLLSRIALALVVIGLYAVLATLRLVDEHEKKLANKDSTPGGSQDTERLAGR